MHPSHTPKHHPANRIVRLLPQTLTKPWAQNVALLALAIVLARSFRAGRIAICLALGITEQSCRKRVQRILTSKTRISDRMRRHWVRCMLALFAPGRGQVPLIIDWTMHRHTCKSLWIAIPIGGRAIPIAFWLAPMKMGGKGAQRAFEDACLQELKGWLPRNRSYVLIGDRGFSSLSRIAFIRQLGFSFILRLRKNTQVFVNGRWHWPEQIAPGLRQQRCYAQVLIGKSSKRDQAYNLVTLREPLSCSKPERDEKGHKTGKLLTQTCWFLVTDLPLSTDIAFWYSCRMQIEELFRDLKSLLGLEQTDVTEPEKRLEWLLWSAMLVWVLCVVSASAPGRLAKRRRASRLDRKQAGAVHDRERALYTGHSGRYSVTSCFREGLHTLLFELIQGTHPLTWLLQSAEAKSQNMRQRPQAKGRRKSTPRLINRGRSNSVQFAS